MSMHANFRIVRPRSISQWNFKIRASNVLIAVRSSSLPPGNKASSTISSSATHPNAANLAKQKILLALLNPTTRFPRLKRKQCVRNAASKPPYRSSQRRGVRCFAGNASKENGKQPRLENGLENHQSDPVRSCIHSGRAGDLRPLAWLN